MLLTLATEWVAWKHVDEAQAALTSAAQIDPTEHVEFEIDPEGFTFRRLLVASQLSLLQGEGAAGIALSDAALEELSGARRAAFLPVAVELYLVGGGIEKAREAVEELREAGPSRTERAQSAEEQLTLLDAVVSDAEGLPYAVIDLMEDLVSTSPQKSAAWRLLSRAYDRTGQGRRSREALERYVTQVPGDWPATLGLARAYRRVDWNKVRKYAERVEQADPSVVEAKLLRCASIIGGVAGELSDTRRQQLSTELAQLRVAFPTSVGVRLLEASLASIAGRVEQAQSVLEEAMAECDDPLAAELQLAALHAGAGRTDEAIELCLAAIARHPDNAEIPRRLAQLQVTAGRVDDARATLAQAARELGGRDGLSAALWLAELELARDERTAAIDRLSKLTADYPDDERAFLALLELPEVLGDPEEGQSLVEGLRRVEGERGLRWQVEQARIWLRQGDWKEHQDQIVERLTKCIQADSGWATPVLVLGQMYEASGQVVDAERTYRQAVESSPAQFGVAGRLLALLERQGRFVEADQLLRRIPTGAAPLAEHRINVLIGLGEIEPAIEELERRVLADPSDAASRVVLAKLVYAQRRDATAALKLLDEAHIASPSLLAALSARAFILHAEDRDDEALALLDSVVAERNDYASYYLRAQYYITVEHWDLAERDLVHLTTFSGRKAEAVIALGQFHNYQGHVSEAVAAWEAGLADEPGNANLRRLMLGVLLVSGDTQQVSRGRKILDELLVELPDDSVLLSMRAALLLEERTPSATSQAQTILERVVTLNPRDVAAALQLFELVRQQGDFSTADRLIVRALGANPNHALLILAQATLEADRKNLDLAWELARSVLDRAGSDPVLLNPLAELALRTGATDLADSLNAKSLELNPGHEIAQVLHASILAWKGEREQAIRDLEAYRQTDEGSRSIRTLLALSESYRVQGEIDIAGQRLDAAASMAPYDRAVLLERCRWLAAQQRYEEMAAVVADYGDYYPGESRAHLLGAWLVSLGGEASHLAQAKSLFEQAVALEPS
ncbi:MAG: tetratricopeptide repeat protein, partial [Armatimonadetes bacterium]|nr:tetratricopeptide repeat protein [Armatimonadota bacterium]